MTKEYEYLKIRLSSISATFENLIPNDPLEQANEDKQNIIKSYILLCHAEFEKYFEDIALEIIKKAKDKYDTNLETSLPLLHLALMLKKDFVNENATERLNKLYSNYHTLIVNNHGIKKSNINDMFAPLGMPISDMTDTYVEALEIFGKKRGQIAHNGKEALTTIYNFFDEKTAIEKLFDDTLYEIDEKAEKLIKL
ncbi:MAG: hypothetical protein IJX99_00625 [Clostridia bacterium]|nr:hypothetical protein [Clostridia bacterium]